VSINLDTREHGPLRQAVIDIDAIPGIARVTNTAREHGRVQNGLRTQVVYTEP